MVDIAGVEVEAHREIRRLHLAAREALDHIK